jgi:Fe2+ transport system protein B
MDNFFTYRRLRIISLKELLLTVIFNHLLQLVIVNKQIEIILLMYDNQYVFRNLKNQLYKTYNHHHYFLRIILMNLIISFVILQLVVELASICNNNVLHIH